MTITLEEKDGAFLLSAKGEVLRTPAGNVYAFPSKALAEAVAQDYEAYETKCAEDKKTQHPFPPLLQLAATLFDILRKNREQVVEGLVSHSVTELLCHRAERPQALTVKQEEAWQPLLEWCAMKYGALLCPHTGLFPEEPSPECVQALHQAISAYDDFVLMGLRHAVDVSGSLVLGLALVEGRLNAAEVFHAAELEAEFQMTTWGVDPLAAARMESIRADLDVCERWFGLVKG